jgi:hypothetical protein
MPRQSQIKPQPKRTPGWGPAPETDQYRQGFTLGMANARSGRPPFYREESLGGRIFNSEGNQVQEHALEFARGCVDGTLIENACNSSPGIGFDKKPVVFRPKSS